MNFEKIKPSTASAIIACSANVFSIGFSFFLLSREMFLTIDVWRLLGICIGVTFPILLINGVIAMFYDRKGQIKAENVDLEKEEVGFWISAAIISTLFINGLLVICYLLKLSLKDFYTLLFLSETITLSVFTIRRFFL